MWSSIKVTALQVISSETTHWQETDLGGIPSPFVSLGTIERHRNRNSSITLAIKAGRTLNNISAGTRIIYRLRSIILICNLVGPAYDQKAIRASLGRGPGRHNSTFDADGNCAVARTDLSARGPPVARDSSWTTFPTISLLGHHTDTRETWENRTRFRRNQKFVRRSRWPVAIATRFTNCLYHILIVNHHLAK